MTALQRLTPEPIAATPESVADEARAVRALPLEVGAESARRFTAALSRRLLNDPRAWAIPALQALGFWLRPASLEPLIAAHFAAPEGAWRAPAGTVFLLPPANVPTLFGYLAALALLGGNVTLVRLPSQATPEQHTLLDLFFETLAESPPALRSRFLPLRYDHDDALTTALSALADRRLVWGADATVEHLRGLKLPPRAQELAFADRFSACALDAAAYAAAPEEERRALARNLARDLYPFDQKACASPRLLVWIGTETDSARAAADFFPRLSADAVAAGYEESAAASLERLTHLCLALHDLDAAAATRYGASLQTVALRSPAQLEAFKETPWGHGLLLTLTLPSLEALARLAERRDQTLGLWGFSPEEVAAFATQCAGRGYNRIVPVGQALAFDPVWDGINLPHALTRLIRLPAPSPATVAREQTRERCG